MTAHSRLIELSLSALAREFGCTRETVRQKLARGGYSPVVSPLQPVPQTADLLGQTDDQVAAVTMYRLRDAIKAFMADPYDNDPSRMAPLQRKQFYQAQREQLELQVQSRDLIPRIEVEAEMSRVAKIVTHALDTLPDILERDCGLKSGEIERVERVIDQVRESLYDEIVREPSP